MNLLPLYFPPGDNFKIIKDNTTREDPHHPFTQEQHNIIRKLISSNADQRVQNSIGGKFILARIKETITVKLKNHR